MTDGLGSPLGNADVPVGTVLAQLRRKAQITGEQLGRRVGISQSKLSKIETGKIIPSVGDVELLARALGASQAVIDSLMRLAESTHGQMTDWRHGRHVDIRAWQQKIGQLEAGARVVRNFSPAVLSGLLQTSSYARGILTTVRRSWPGQWGTHVRIADAVSARMQRQVVLDDTDKTFQFVLPETSLRNLFGRPEEMPAQLARLWEVSQLQNVHLSLITEETPWPVPPLHGFTVLDDRHVVIDLHNTVVVSQDRFDLQLYRKAFDILEDKATADIEPILNRYRRLYLQRAQEN